MTIHAIFTVRPAAPSAWPARLPALLLQLLLLPLLLFCVAPGYGGVPNLERGVKAAYLYKFLGYVEFPAAEAATPLVVGVLEADDIGAELARITTGRSVNGRPVTVRLLHDGDAVAGVQMLFVAAAAARPVTVLRAAAQGGVLGVTEDENGLQQGAVINFRLVDDRVRFEVSLPAAERSNVKLSSRLLSVAWHVQKGN